MKFLYLFFLFLFFITGCAVKKSAQMEMPAAETTQKVAEIKPEYLWAFLPAVNVRAAARENAEKLTQLNDGDSVAVLSNRDGWYEISTADRKQGWVRSDLLGPKNFSAFKRAVSFVDSLREKTRTEIFFDKKLYHKRIYIRFPAAMYQSRTRIEQETKNILNAYQQEVYRGDVSARVLNPGGEEEFMTMDSAGEVNADPLLPVIPFGLLKQAHRRYAQGITLTYSVPDTINDQQLLRTARMLSASYPLSYKRIEISFKSSRLESGNNCRLWFVEDARGEEFKWDECL
jgi:SH3-like domain-containing protein